MSNTNDSTTNNKSINSRGNDNSNNNNNNNNNTYQVWGTCTDHNDKNTNTTNTNKFYPHRDNFDPLQSNKPQIQIIGILIDEHDNNMILLPSTPPRKE